MKRTVQSGAASAFARAMLSAVFLACVFGAQAHALVCGPQPQTTATRPVSGGAAAPDNGARVKTLLDRMPLSFEANAGQFDARVKFLARGPGHHVSVTSEGLVLVLQETGQGTGGSAVIRVELAGGNKGAEPRGVDRLERVSNYFYGADASQFITGVPNFARVRQKEIYPGIDVVYYGNQRRLEYDFVVAPGADTKRIKLRLSGHESARLSESGDLVVATKVGGLVLKTPKAYQEQGGRRVEVPTNYVLIGNQVRFDVGAYDRGRELVIDPIVGYSTVFGGSGNDVAGAIAVGADGSTYIAGQTSSTDLPVSSAFQSKLLSVADAFVAKLNPGGTAIVYSTYLGGRNGASSAGGIAVDAAGNAYVAGRTQSSQFPVTTGAYQTTFNASGGNAFISKLGPQGNTLVYSTYVHGVDNNGGIAIDASGNAVFVGFTGFSAPSFVTTPGAFQPSPAGSNDAFVLKLNAAGSAAVYATYLGGADDDRANGVALDSAENAYVAGLTNSANFPVVNPFQPSPAGGQDAFVTKLGPTGAVVYSSYLGGSDRDTAGGIAVDALGNAYIGGTTFSRNFPVVRATPLVIPQNVPSNFVAFVAKVNASGSALAYSGLVGTAQVASTADTFGIAVDRAGNAYLAGVAYLPNYFQVDPIVPNLGDTEQMAFVAKVQELDQMLVTYAAVFGTPQQLDGSISTNGIAVDANANVYVVGSVSGKLFPTTPGAFQRVVRAQDSYVFKLSSAGRFPTKVSASLDLPTSADSIVLRAAVANAAAGGTVTFSSDGNPIGTVPVSGGGAALTVSLPAGVHEIAAVYSGDGKVSQPLFLPVRQASICN